MQHVPAKRLPGTESPSPRNPYPGSDIILCQNCNWNADMQQHCYYNSTVKCIFAMGDRATWQIGDKYLLKQRPLRHFRLGEDYMGPDTVTTNWVRENTTIPVPGEIREWTDEHNRFFLIEKMPGKSLEAAWPLLSTEEKKKYAYEVIEYVAQLRTHTAPKPQTVDGAPVLDKLIGDRNLKMMLSEDKEAWWASMEKGFPLSTAWREELKAQYPDHKAYVLTHGNLNTRNITIHEGRVSGIIDWENAGYYPDWWEYAAVYAWVEEGEWDAYLSDAMKERFGEYIDEARWAMKVRQHYFRDNLPDPGPDAFPRRRDPFCACKPYRNFG